MTPQHLIEMYTDRWQQADQWQQPNTKDALLFAVTELGEAVDELLRIQGGFVRNNPAPSDLDALAREITDTIMMCMIALSSIGRNFEQELDAKLTLMDAKRQ